MRICKRHPAGCNSVAVYPEVLRVCMTQHFTDSFCHLLMKQSLTLILLFSSIISFGQKSNKWQLLFQLQPELTFHKNQYSYRWKERSAKQTFNAGIASSIQYNVTSRIFIEGGLAFVSRKLAAKAFIDQSLLPPPYYDSTQLLHVTKSISLRTLQFPFGMGATILKTAKAGIFVKGTCIPNFLMNAKYKVNDYPGFKKNYWQGYSLLAGIGMDYRLNNEITFTSLLEYSLINTVAKDPYLFSQDETIALPHTYLRGGMGIKINLY